MKLSKQFKKLSEFTQNLMFDEFSHIARNRISETAWIKYANQFAKEIDNGVSKGGTPVRVYWAIIEARRAQEENLRRKKLDRMKSKVRNHFLVIEDENNQRLA